MARLRKDWGAGGETRKWEVLFHLLHSMSAVRLVCVEIGSPEMILGRKNEKC